MHVIGLICFYKCSECQKKLNLCKTAQGFMIFVHFRLYTFNLKAAMSVTFDLLTLELMFLFFKNTVKKTKIQVYILPIS